MLANESGEALVRFEIVDALGLPISTGGPLAAGHEIRLGHLVPLAPHMRVRCHLASGFVEGGSGAVDPPSAVRGIVFTVRRDHVAAFVDSTF